MQDILIVPTYDRPEFLWLCLDYLERCVGIEDVEIRVHLDVHTGEPPRLEETEEVLAKFHHLRPELYVSLPHSYRGNSSNLMLAYLEASYSRFRHVFMVENDVLVRSDFLQWHREQHHDPEVKCSVAVEKPSHGAYASLGVCFQRAVLQQIVAHATPLYFSDMRGYCTRMFPPLSFDCEQDGLIARVLHDLPGKVVWSSPPRAQHVGWYGYHREKSKRPKGSLEDRYTTIKRVLSSEDELAQWVRDFHDIKTLDKDGGF